MRRLRRSPAGSFPAIVLLLASVACSGRGTARGPPDVITREQISALPDLTAHEIIERLRPSWFRSQTANFGGPIPPVVYLDGRRGSLAGIRSSYIERIEHLDSRDATTRYGTGHMGGVIRVVTRPFAEGRR